MREALAGSMPTTEEMDAFLTFFDVETRATIAFTEFADALSRLKERSAAPQPSVHYTSFVK